MSVLSPTKAIKMYFAYAPQDQPLYNQLVKHLSILKHHYPIHEWYDSAISAGSPTTQFIETRLNMADIIVLLISADFFALERCYTLEMLRAIERSKTGGVRLIPVHLRPVDWQTCPLHQYHQLPQDGIPITRWTNRDAAFSEVTRGIRQVIEELSSQESTYTHSVPQCVSFYNPPHTYNDFFTDRDAIFDKISSFFAAARNHRTPVLALSGLGGMGKTQVALEYSYRSSDMYQAILWLNASSRSVLTTEVSTLVDHLSIPRNNSEDEQHLFTTIKQWLQNQPNWLLVLDQINDVTLVDLIIPKRSSGHVLLTTRAQAMGKRGLIVSLKSINTNESALFLLHRSGLIPADTHVDQIPADTLREATTIAQAMDGFPLALDQAGAYIEEKGCTLLAYLTLYKQQRAKLLSERGQLANDHQESVTSTLTLSFEQVALKNPTNLDLLYLLAFLQPDAIPEGFLTHGAPDLGEPLRSLVLNALALQQALADLRSFSLIHHGADRSLLQIHRIVQDVLIDTLTPSQQRQWARRVVRLVNRVFPEVSFAAWTDCKRYLPQAQHCATLIHKYELTMREGASLLERLGTYCSQCACYAEAETYLKQALDLYEHHLIVNALDTAQALNSLALLYYQQARYTDAERLHQRALTLREQALGPDHPKTAESLHNLAMLYGEMGDYQHAEQIYLRALSLEERAKGPDHPDVAKTLNNLGLMYYKQGYYSQTETLYRRALTIYECSLPPNHPDLAYTLNSLGTLYEKRGEYLHAEELYQRAHAIREQTLGERHPDVALSLNKLAGIAEARGNYQHAEALYQRALAIGESTLGPMHPDIALFLNNLALLANKLGQYQQAEPLYQRALHIYEQTLKPKHPYVASVLNNLGQLYRKINNDERANTLLRRALAIREEMLGTTHPTTAQSLSNLANLLITQHVYEEAESLLLRALAIYLHTFGPNHPNTARVHEQYATLLERMGRNDEARVLQQTIQQKELPSTEPSLDDH